MALYKTGGLVRDAVGVMFTPLRENVLQLVGFHHSCDIFIIGHLWFSVVHGLCHHLLLGYHCSSLLFSIPKTVLGTEVQFKVYEYKSIALPNNNKDNSGFWALTCSKLSASHMSFYLHKTPWEWILRSSIAITWELVSNANFQALHRRTDSDTLPVGASHLCFNKPPMWFWCRWSLRTPALGWHRQCYHCHWKCEEGR